MQSWFAPAGEEDAGDDVSDGAPSGDDEAKGQASAIDNGGDDGYQSPVEARPPVSPVRTRCPVALAWHTRWVELT